MWVEKVGDNMRTTNGKRFAHYSLALKDKSMTIENVTIKPERPFLHLKSALLHKQSLDSKKPKFSARHGSVCVFNFSSWEFSLVY